MTPDDPLAAFHRLRIERRDHGVVLITLDDPERLNATDGPTHNELSRVFRAVDEDPSIAAVVVTGAGRARSATTRRRCA